MTCVACDSENVDAIAEHGDWEKFECDDCRHVWWGESE